MDKEQLFTQMAPRLGGVGKAYGAIMRMREHAYNTGLFKSYRAEAPVVSIGNISMGGSGKTPLAIWLLRHLANMKLTAALLTRGYGAKPPHLPFMVRPDSDPAASGDEPLLIARTVPEASVVVDPKRSRGAVMASRYWHPDIYVLDDGFQHMAMQRDIDLVLLRPEDLDSEWSRVFPGGTWRENAKALNRASALLIKTSREDFSRLDPLIASRLATFGKPIFGFDLQPTGLRNIATNTVATSLGNHPENSRYLLASGVAHPHQVARTAEQLLGYPPVDIVPFADHHAYTAEDVASLRKRAGNKPVIVTAKDAVKLHALADDSFYCLEADVVFHEHRHAGSDFEPWLDSALGAARTEHNG